MPLAAFRALHRVKHMTSSRRDRPSRDGISFLEFPRGTSGTVDAGAARPRGRASARSRRDLPLLPAPPRPPSGEGKAASREALGGRPLLARRRARRRRRGGARGADARRDRARLRHLEMTGTAAGERARELRARRARLRRRDRRARDRDHGLAPARAVLRVVDASCGRTSSGSCSPRSRSATGSAAGSPTGGPSRGSSASIVLAAAVFVAVIPFAAKPFLDFTVEGLDTASAGAVVGSFLAVLLLCAPPVVLLGMVSPFAIRLAVSSIATAGAVAGRLYALSTAGIAARHVPARARPHPRDRDAADVPRRRGAARGVVVLPARRALPRRDRRSSRRCCSSRRARSRARRA